MPRGCAGKGGPLHTTLAGPTTADGAPVTYMAGEAHHGVASPDDAVPVLTLACPAGSVLAGLLVGCLGVGFIVAGSVSGGASRCMVGWFAVESVVPPLASVLVGRFGGSWCW